MTSTQDRMLDSVIAAIRKHRLDDLITTVRTIAAYDSAGVDSNDGWGTTTPGNGSPGSGKGGGRQMAIETPEGNTDRVPTSSTEAAAFMRLERGRPDEIHGLHRADVQALRKILDGMNTIAANAKRAENLRSISDLCEPTSMCWFAQKYELPWDIAWEIHKHTDFVRHDGTRYTSTEWPERRPVCRFAYEFVRTNFREPTKEEMLTHLQRGVVRVHETTRRGS